VIFRFLHGDPVDRLWVVYVGIGTTGVGLLSIQSSGPPVALVPMFIAAAITTLLAALFRAKGWAIGGLGMASLASWIRAATLWGVDQQGAGASTLATFVWLWIATGAALLAVAVGARGME
jgi:hypothetical protein